MPDIGASIEIGAEWVDVTTGAALADGTTYVLKAEDELHSDQLVYWAKTDDGSPPSRKGQPWMADRTQGRHAQNSGERIWLRSGLGTVQIDVTPI